jgi:hypothetical protein
MSVQLKGQRRYNYLPHPISEYGPYRALPTDNVLTLLARKDQACWNLWYLSDGSIDTWHKIVVQPSNEKYVEGSRQIGSALAMRYRLMETQFDGVTLRHQLEHLPPEDFLRWFYGIGGYDALPFFGTGQLGAFITPKMMANMTGREHLVKKSAHVITQTS